MEGRWEGYGKWEEEAASSQFGINEVGAHLSTWQGEVVLTMNVCQLTTMQSVGEGGMGPKPAVVWPK